MNFLYYSFLMLFLLLSLFLVLLVLIQKGRGGGLSAAFGGVGGNTAFGAKTGDVLTWATSIIFGVFLLLAIGLNLIANRLHDEAKNPYAKATTTAPTDAPAAASNKDILTPSPAVIPSVTPPTTTPTVSPTAPNPTPKPPASPTTNPSTNPTAAIPSAAVPSAVAPAAIVPTTRP